MEEAHDGYDQDMNPRRMWTEPEYRHRPLQILLRLARARWRPQRALVTLPWGVKLEVRPRDAIGIHIWLRGVFDLPVTETLWRLATPGGVAADVGANIGYMTSILAARGAVVHAFEPCPPALQELRRNVARWPGARVTVHPLALTDRVGRLHMVMPPPDAANLGLAAIGPGDIEVEGSTLDQVLGGVSELGILKLDVEGHELHVLQGSAALLAAGVIRDIVFEEHRPVPSPVTEFLARHGYRIFSLSYDVRGLSVKPLGQPNKPLPAYQSPSYLATIRAEEVLALLDPPGWYSLRGRS